jgi:RNA-directed DNA polymerase
MVSGNRAQAEALLPEVAAVLAPMGLRLSAEKTMITHIDEGLDFLGWRIQRYRKRGTGERYVYTLSVEESAARDHDEGQDGVPAERERFAGRPAASAEPDVAGLDGLLPARGVPSDFPVPAVLCVAPGHALDSQETPPDQLGETASPLLHHDK